MADPRIDTERVQLAQGDCIDWIGRLHARMGGFQLVYLDPPFNAGGTRRAREKQGERVRGSRAYRDAWGGIDAFLAMLTPRIASLRDTMTDDGSLWLHLDHRAVHDAKVAVDRIFGRSAFVGDVIWVPGNGSRRRNAPAVTHQTLLVYRKGKEMIWNSDAPELREPFAETSQRMHFTKLGADGRAYRERTIAGKTYRYYADRGRLIGSVWTDCPAMSANTPLRSETTGYPTQKPESLLRRIVVGASHPDGAVCDPMCGSGTTLAVAVAHGRRAAGCDASALACRLTGQRVRNALATAFR